MIYFDHNATTPMDEVVASRLTELSRQHWGNPSSGHALGRDAAKLLAEAREFLADLIGAGAREIVFTSGGTEANNLILHSAWQAVRGSRPEIVSSPVEHSSVLHTLAALAHEGAVIRYLHVDSQNRLDLEAVRAAINARTGLVVTMLANNEIGNIYPVKEIAELAHAQGAYFFTDAVCAMGKLKVDVGELGCDFLSFSGHKFYGPKGVGGVYARHGVSLHPLHLGGDQERGKRAGTENVPAIAAMVLALERAVAELSQTQQKIAELRAALLAGLLTLGIRQSGDPTHAVSNTLNLQTGPIKGESLVAALDLRGIAVSSGSACASGSIEPSHVLLAMGQTRQQALGSLRVSLGKNNTLAEVDDFLRAMKDIVLRVAL